MCLSTQALALFISLLDPQLVETEGPRVTIHATDRDAVWVYHEDQWCTDAPAHKATLRRS